MGLKHPIRKTLRAKHRCLSEFFLKHSVYRRLDIHQYIALWFERALYDAHMYRLFPPFSKYLIDDGQVYISNTCHHFNKLYRLYKGYRLDILKMIDDDSKVSVNQRINFRL